MYVSIEEPLLTPEQEQRKWLGEAIQNVEEKTEQLHQAISDRETTKVLRAASQILSELRTGMLVPQYYYELYMRVFDEMTQVETYILDELQSKRLSAEQIYSTAQHAGNIIPRLYLLIVVGSAYVKTQPSVAKEILQDLIELCRGVQHPTRGMFLRYFLLSMMKNKLPDVDNDYAEGGTVLDSAGFIISNLREMTWLWYRMESKPTIPKKDKRDKERRELRVLVGFNLVRLSQLDGIDRTIYQERVLPVLLRIIMDYPDAISQQYLLEVVVQTFSDDYHLLTLDQLLEALGRVCVGVNLHAVLNALMDRLGNYVTALRDGVTEGGDKKETKVIKKMFTVFQDSVNKFAENTSIMSPAAFAETAGGLIRLAQKAYPGEAERVDSVISSTHAYFAALPSVVNGTGLDEATTKALRKTAESVVQLYAADPPALLDLEHFADLVQCLNFASRRAVATTFAKAVGVSGKKVDTIARVGRFFDLIATIVQDGPDTPSEQEQIYTIDVKEEFAEEQHLVCRALQAIDTPDLATLSKIYSGVRKQLGRGGAERMRFTLKAMTSMYTRLALRCAKATANLQEGEEDHGVNLTKIFTFIHSGDGVGMLELLCDTAPLEAFPYYLHSAGVADACALGEQCYDLMAAAFMVYEQRGAADTKLQIQCLTQLISTVAATRNLPEETYMQLAAKLCQYSSGLLLKQDNSRLALLCSHLFWKKALSEDSRRMTLDCLQRALKQADKSPASTQYELFTEALNRYSYYFAAAMPLVEPKHVNSLIDMVRTAKDAAASASAPAAAAASTMMPTSQVATYAQNTMRYLTNRKRDGGDERWDEIDL